MSKCYCTALLRPDGTCRYGCPPELRRPARRAERAALVMRERERTEKLISREQASEGMLQAMAKLGIRRPPTPIERWKL